MLLKLYKCVNCVVFAIKFSIGFPALTHVHLRRVLTNFFFETVSRPRIAQFKISRPFFYIFRRHFLTRLETAESAPAQKSLKKGVFNFFKKTFTIFPPSFPNPGNRVSPFSQSELQRGHRGQAKERTQDMSGKRNQQDEDGCGPTSSGTTERNIKEEKKETKKNKEEQQGFIGRSVTKAKERMSAIGGNIREKIPSSSSVSFSRSDGLALLGAVVSLLASVGSGIGIWQLRNNEDRCGGMDPRMRDAGTAGLAVLAVSGAAAGISLMGYAIKNVMGGRGGDDDAPGPAMNTRSKAKDN